MTTKWDWGGVGVTLELVASVFETLKSMNL